MLNFPCHIFNSHKIKTCVMIKLELSSKDINVVDVVNSQYVKNYDH